MKAAERPLRTCFRRYLRLAGVLFSQNAPLAVPQNRSKEVLIKSGMQIAQTDFSVDCMKMTQEYLMYFKEFSCNQAENMQARCVPRFIQRFLNVTDIARIKAAACTKKRKERTEC